MKPILTFSHIEASIKNPLPGWEGQKLLAPEFREEEMVRMKDKMAMAKQSAVLILIYEKNSHLTIPFIKRASYDGIHSGQISLPGGKKEKSDMGFAFTALRETQEELGIPMSKIKIIGQLSDLYIPPSNFLVKPFIGISKEVPKFNPDSVEVERIIEIPIYELFEIERVKLKAFYRSSDGLEKKAPYYDLKEAEIWGATAMIISEFCELIRQ